MDMAEAVFLLFAFICDVNGVTDAEQQAPNQKHQAHLLLSKDSDGVSNNLTLQDLNCASDL